MTTDTTPISRFVVLDSKDPIVRFWANKAVQVLDNPELSEQGRARIVRDIQEKIQAHRASLPKKGQGPQAAKTKPAGLGCPTQMARLRDSFKQASVPVEAVVAKPIKKVRLPPRSQKA